MSKEKNEQIAIINYCELRGAPYNLIFHIPNGGSRNIIEAVNLRKQGVKAGVPDLFLPVPTTKYHGLFIELKRSEGSARVSATQKKWLDLLEQNKYKAIVCYGAEHAIQEIEAYLSSC